MGFEHDFFLFSKSLLICIRTDVVFSLSWSSAKFQSTGEKFYRSLHM